MRVPRESLKDLERFLERRAGRIGVLRSSSTEGRSSDLVDDLESSALARPELILDSTNIWAAEEV